MSPTGGRTATPLCVDLDGTLLHSDVGVESALLLLKRNPLYLLAMLWWALRGWAALKQEVARRIELPVDALPWDERVLDWVRGQYGTRPCLLVTASDVNLARSVSEHLGCFDTILASDGNTNLAAHAKAQALVDRFGKSGFDYVGNSRSDLPVWRQCRQAIVANAPAALLRQVQAKQDVNQVFPRIKATKSDWAKALRLHHWVKNLLVFAPLIGAHRLHDTSLLLHAALAWLLFGFCTSGTYLINDLLDLDADRRHRYKRHRPLASGRIELLAATGMAPLLIGVSLLLAACLLPLPFSAWLAAYLALTLAYSLGIKRVLLLDTITLACLFTLRILAGGGATGIAISHWLLGLSMLLFLALALLKRYVELVDLDPTFTMPASGRSYHRKHLLVVKALGITASVAGILLFALYINSPDSAALYQHPRLLWLLCPLLGYWLARLWWLAGRNKVHSDPIVFATRDLQSWLILVAGAALTWAAS